MNTLLIIGASGRAAAHSAIRAGLSPIVIDLFADRDVAEVASAQTLPSESYPNGFERYVGRNPAVPWMYTGALENHPDLIDRMAAIAPLWGISGEALRSVRDHELLAETLRAAGFIVPKVLDSPQELPRDGSWLVKPRKSAGGRSISSWVESSPSPDRPSYYQERIDGIALAAIFVGSSFLGVTRQFQAEKPASFAYVGSIGPWPLSDVTRAEIEKIGRTLAETFGLCGVFGVDGILREDGRFVVVEVNPRYTASVEVLELALGISLLAEHRRAFVDEGIHAKQDRLVSLGYVGKKILFAKRISTLPALDPWNSARRATLLAFSEMTGRDVRPTDKHLTDPRRLAAPALADIPQVGTVFAPGEPVVTVLAVGSTLESCQARLGRRFERWRRRLIPQE